MIYCIYIYTIIVQPRFIQYKPGLSLYHHDTMMMIPQLHWGILKVSVSWLLCSAVGPNPTPARQLRGFGLFYHQVTSLRECQGVFFGSLIESIKSYSWDCLKMSGKPWNLTVILTVIIFPSTWPFKSGQFTNFTRKTLTPQNGSPIL